MGDSWKKQSQVEVERRGMCGLCTPYTTPPTTHQHHPPLQLRIPPSLQPPTTSLQLRQMNKRQEECTSRSCCLLVLMLAHTEIQKKERILRIEKKIGEEAPGNGERGRRESVREPAQSILWGRQDATNSNSQLQAPKTAEKATWATCNNLQRHWEKSYSIS